MKSKKIKAKKKKAPRKSRMRNITTGLTEIAATAAAQVRRAPRKPLTAEDAARGKDERARLRRAFSSVKRFVS